MRRKALQRKRAGGVKLEIHVSKTTRINGPYEDQPHEPFLRLDPRTGEAKRNYRFSAATVSGVERLQPSRTVDWAAGHAA